MSGLSNQGADQDAPPNEGAGEGVKQDDVLLRIGHMTRTLHDSLRGLGLDKLLKNAAEDIPNARDRLDYVAKKSEEAAQKVLNATDAAIPLQEKIDTGAKGLSGEWKALMEAEFTEAAYRALAQQTLLYLSSTNQDTSSTKSHLMDIMMAQDFQDLTGQVIKKITELAQNMEQQLIQILIDYSPADVKRSSGEGLLNGPQMNPHNKVDVVAGQEQVDDLLDSLGF
ncbi:protein phosphatase CheZ [Solimicrobium silvestre]|uniref:Protein phosphatase CheZ n=1 Tax=Solimicrobium silvestre TaxID=2099400 RepID=A0A2S9GZ26_9BURK|nr:protein phosphatase CheZ [Solimicrobium silvestre]PRC92975.1 Chemotaxis protein [Solimicrobium silvestre]